MVEACRIHFEDLLNKESHWRKKETRTLILLLKG